MPNLLDIAALESSVEVRGKRVPCFGLGAKQIVDLVTRFPVLKETLFPAGALQMPSEVSDPLGLIHAAPDAISAILAAGTGHLGDQQHEEAASNLGLEEQIDLLTEILKLTLPNGLVPFMEKLTVLFGGVSGNPQAPLSADEQLKPISLPNGRASDTDLPSQSSS